MANWMKGTYSIGGRDEELFLEVNIGDGTEREGKWFSPLMVSCGFRGHRAAPDIPLIIRRNGDDQRITGARSDRNGAYNCDVELPGPGKYFLSAQVPGTSIEVGDWTTAKAEMPKPKKMKDPLLRADGAHGRYVISVQQVHDDDTPANDVPVRLIVARFGAEPEVVDLKTDANGFAIDEETDLPYRLEFSESRCSVAVQVAGREIVLKNLAGPPQAATGAAAVAPAMATPKPQSLAEELLGAFQRGRSGQPFQA